MDIDTLLKTAQQVNLMGLVGVEKKAVGEKSVVLVKFWRLRGAFQNDKTACITMLLDPAGPMGDLFFFAGNLEECEPRELALTIYMDANMRVLHGAHRWQAGAKGDVVFSYSLPVPPGLANYPDKALLQALLKDMYEGLLFRELKDREIQITRDDMLNDAEKKEKFLKVMDMYRRLTNPLDGDDGLV